LKEARAAADRESDGGLPVEAWFDDFSVEPLASASIAQVHTARLKENGKEVVIKVIRPDILPIIKADMKLIYRLARWVPRLLPDGRRLRPQEVVREYEKTLLDELNLLRNPPTPFSCGVISKTARCCMPECTPTTAAKA
jgi:predicted unusual protein kinase regulating ubiquinone biosynthesis (AarF/ABC1/UbiB family)